LKAWPEIIRQAVCAVQAGRHASRGRPFSPCRPVGHPTALL